MREFEETAFAFDRACRTAEVGYAFIGGIAVIAWGQPRTTSDVDALLTPPRDFRRLVEALGAEGLEASVEDFSDSLQDGSHVTVFDARGRFHVDVKLARKETEREQVAAATDVVLDRGTLRVASPEHTVAYKLVFGSEQDVKDARSIVVRQEGRLDLARLRALARRLDVEDALDDLLASVA